MSDPSFDPETKDDTSAIQVDVSRCDAGEECGRDWVNGEGTLLIVGQCS